MKMRVDAILPVARKAVSLATTVTRTVQRDLERVRAHLKDDKSPVTVADLASQAIVAKVLAVELGAIPLVAEEDAQVLRERPELAEEVATSLLPVWPGARPEDAIEAIERGRGEPSRAFFTLDPIDGTKGYLRGEQYAVSLALIFEGEVALGILGCPNLSPDFLRPFGEPDPVGLAYFATKKSGLCEAPLNDPLAQPAMRIRAKRDPSASIRLAESVESGHTKHDASAAVLAKLGRRVEAQRLDSQAKYAVVARGQADVYLRMPTKKGYVEKIWDHAAGAVIAEEAGIVISDVRGKPLDFSRGSTLSANLGVVAAPPELHGELVRAIADLELDREPG
jgi:3'(2'), 5'-bisphosphate nucleotidase